MHSAMYHRIVFTAGHVARRWAAKHNGNSGCRLPAGAWYRESCYRHDAGTKSAARTRTWLPKGSGGTLMLPRYDPRRARWPGWLWRQVPLASLVIRNGVNCRHEEVWEPV
jgi:hypothetical protein